MPFNCLVGFVPIRFKRDADQPFEGGVLEPAGVIDEDRFLIEHPLLGGVGEGAGKYLEAAFLVAGGAHPSGFDEAGAVFAVSVLGLGFEEGADLEG